MYLLRRFYRSRQAFGNSGSSIQILERRPLSPKATLYLLEVEGHTLLIGLSPSGIHRLAQCPEEEVDLSWALEEKVESGVES